MWVYCQIKGIRPFLLNRGVVLVWPGYWSVVSKVYGQKTTIPLLIDHYPPPPVQPLLTTIEHNVNWLVFPLPTWWRIKDDSAKLETRISNIPDPRSVLDLTPLPSPNTNFYEGKEEFSNYGISSPSRRENMCPLAKMRQVTTMWLW